MNGGPWQLTKREMHTLFGAPRFWVGFGAVVIVLALSGPFDTQDLMNFAERLVYWGFIGFVTFVLGISTSFLVGLWLWQAGWNELLARAIGGFMGGVPITVFVWFANQWLFGMTMRNFPELLLYCCGISLAVTILFFLIQNTSAPEQSDRETSDRETSDPETAHATQNASGADKGAANSQSAFFDRLPVELGQDLISLQAQDHYIRAVTTKGSHMLLMRMEDACRELENTNGLRVHRSWWVARRHMRKLNKEANKLTVTLSDGQTAPVSRSNRKILVNEIKV
ncbi:MAG: LytTR family DNA-binding domain-containing protein [Pseudomonadota bacterium]